jgi:signal transduction histidine kinase
MAKSLTELKLCDGASDSLVDLAQPPAALHEDLFARLLNTEAVEGGDDLRDGRTKTLEQVEQAKREWESTVDALPDLVSLVDSQARVIRINRAVEAWHLDRVNTARGRGLHDVLHPACSRVDCYLTSFVRQIVEHVMAGDSIQHETYDALLERYFQISARPVLDRRGGASRTAVVVIRDITDQKRAEHERENLIEELDAFAHTVAHDLKNPVGLVIGYATLMQQRDSMPAEELQACLQALGRVGYKMNNIINELLLLAQLRHADVPPEPLDMPAILGEVRQRLDHLIQERHAQIVLPADWPLAFGHAPWVEEVWVNYLSNALKYGGEPPRVEMGGELQPDGMACFWVRDNGLGIAPELQSQLYKPFARLAQVRATGQGLGLSIVRRIIERLGGEVGVKSDHQTGLGSTFYFTLPATDV